MWKSSINPADLPEHSLVEVSQHRERNDRWIVIEGLILDVSSWARKHPGGEKIISSFAGQDATEAWYAFHTNKDLVSKYMKPLVVGKLRKNVGPDCSAPRDELLRDFKAIRKSAEDLGLFRPNTLFYVLIMAHILFFDFLGWWTMYKYGIGWIPYVIASCFLTIAQGASSDWWNFRHLNHHAKPNVISKDPDITLAPLFLVGRTLAMEYGKKKKKYLPYKLQHKYFYFVLPPLLLPLYFNVEIPYFLIKRKKWMEMFWMSLFFLRWQIMFSSMLGIVGAFLLFLFVSLFPTMPRHNLVKVSPQVRALCDKHNLSYQVKPLWKAFGDIISSLEKSGDIWWQFYNT